MQAARVFISSVQKELAAERRATRDFVEGDAVLRGFFTVFLFEDLPAGDQCAVEVYLGAPVFRHSGGQFARVLQRPPELATPVVTPEVTTEVAPELRLLRALAGEMTRQQLQTALGLNDDENFRKAYLQPALDAGLIEMTVPDKPRGTRQKYPMTVMGEAERDKNGTYGT